MGYAEDQGDYPVTEDGVTTAYSDVHYLETWAAFEEIYESGKARAIGLSNFSIKQAQQVLKAAKIRPAVVQFENHPYLTQEKYFVFAQEEGCVVMGYAPLGSPDRPWAKPGDLGLLDDPKLKEIAAKHCKSVAQVLIRFQLQRGAVVFPMSVIPWQIKENAQVFDFILTPEDMDLIKGFNRNHHFYSLDWLKDHPHHPFFGPERDEDINQEGTGLAGYKPS